MAFTLSSQQTMHALLLFLPLDSPLLLITSTFVAEFNSACDCFKQGEHLKIGASQDNALGLFKMQARAKSMTKCLKERNLVLC